MLENNFRLDKVTYLLRTRGTQLLRRINSDSLHGNLCCLHRVISIESQLVEIHFNIIFLNSCKRDNLKLVFKMSNIAQC